MEYFPGIEKDHDRNFLRNHGIPWQKDKKDEFCKIGAINIYFKSIVYNNDEELFVDNQQIIIIIGKRYIISTSKVTDKIITYA